MARGYLCKELEEIFQCTDTVIHNALLGYGVTQKEIYDKGLNKKSIIAFDVETKKPLKLFSSIQEASKFFNLDIDITSSIRYALKNPYKNTAYGYYWDYKKEDNLPLEEIDIENFLQYQKKIRTYSEEYKEKLSLSKRKVDRPNREELKKMIHTTSFFQLGKQFGVSGTTIRKWCDYYNLPRHKRKINKISDEEWDKI